MQVEIRCRTQEALSVPDRSGEKRLTELGHVKDMFLDTSVGSGGLSSAVGRLGGAEQSAYIQTGCLIRHSTQRLGKPATGGRT